MAKESRVIYETTYRGYDPEHDEPVNGWHDEMINHARQQGKTLVVDDNGDVWTYNGHVCDYVGKVRRRRMSEYMSAKELAEMVSVSESKAYCFIRQMNEELKAKGLFIVRGKVPRKYARERFGVSE